MPHPGAGPSIKKMYPRVYTPGQVHPGRGQRPQNPLHHKEKAGAFRRGYTPDSDLFLAWIPKDVL